MSVPDQPMTPFSHHLVLGGSHGIGYAYAEYRAREGHSLVLVGRERTALSDAELRLQDAGATAVALFDGDILDPGFRAYLFESLNEVQFGTVLIGGPSPPSGNPQSVTVEKLRQANETCLVYPFEVLRWLSSRSAEVPERAIILSSSVVRHVPCHQVFFFSGLYRRALDELLHCMRNEVPFSVETWYPKLVRTRLAERLAHSLQESYASGDLEFILTDYLHEPVVLDPAEYIQHMISGNP